MLREDGEAVRGAVGGMVGTGHPLGDVEPAHDAALDVLHEGDACERGAGEVVALLDLAGVEGRARGARLAGAISLAKTSSIWMNGMLLKL
ncbi:hypothetical protein [Streptomyces sp. CAU 1734]|uniref:hypothetical protein n=1 Tax=Streptomyces sp. CAU 1734 TaxID=3140360 RepID=UPI0032602880